MNDKIKINLTGERKGTNGKAVKTGTIEICGKIGNIEIFDLGDCSTDPKWMRDKGHKVAGSRNAFEVLCQAAYRAES